MAVNPRISRYPNVIRHAPLPLQQTLPNDLEPYWMPFTPNRAFKKRPRLVVSAKDMHYVTADGRRVLDGSAGLWCVNTGHNRDSVVAAIQAQAAELDYAPAFQFAHPKAFELARARRSACARRSRSRVLLQFRIGGGRHRAQDRARLSQCVAAMPRACG